MHILVTYKGKGQKELKIAGGGAEGEAQQMDHAPYKTEINLDTHPPLHPAGALGVCWEKARLVLVSKGGRLLPLPISHTCMLIGLASFG